MEAAAAEKELLYASSARTIRFFVEPIVRLLQFTYAQTEEERERWRTPSRVRTTELS